MTDSTKRVVGQVADMELDVVLGDLAPGPDAFMQGRDVEEGPNAQLELPLALGEVVDDGHAMACPRERHRRRPAEVAVTAEHEDSLSHVQLPSRGSPCWTPRPGLRGSAGVYHRTAAANVTMGGTLAPMLLRQFVIDGLGHLSTLIADESAGLAAVVDPRRDVDIYLEAARSADVRITHVVETHLHNDYVSGGRELAALTGATHVIGAGADLAYEHRPVRDRESFDVGALRFTALETPGHTPEHVAYAVADTSRAGEPLLLFTGGSLLVGAVGRTDLLGEENALPYARSMFHSHPGGDPAARGLRRGLSDPRRGLPLLDRVSPRRRGRRSASNGATTPWSSRPT